MASHLRFLNYESWISGSKSEHSLLRGEFSALGVDIVFPLGISNWRSEISCIDNSCAEVRPTTTRKLLYLFTSLRFLPRPSPRQACPRWLKTRPVFASPNQDAESAKTGGFSTSAKIGLVPILSGFVPESALPKLATLPEMTDDQAVSRRSFILKSFA
jgi:hypothetical protein